MYQSGREYATGEAFLVPATTRCFSRSQSQKDAAVSTQVTIDSGVCVGGGGCPVTSRVTSGLSGGQDCAWSLPARARAQMCAPPPKSCPATELAPVCVDIHHPR